jgi:choline dehydrogenase-like flavoprotein
VNGYLDRPALGVVGFETHAALDDLHPSDSKRGFIRGGVIGENNIPTRQPLVYTTFGPPGHPRYDRAWGAELKDYLRKFPRAFSVVAVLEDLPMHQNTVDLDPDVVDRWGLPVVRMTHTQHPNDIAMARWYEQRLLEIAEAAGATEKWISKPPGLYIDDEHSMTGSPAHFHGTCRAGNDPGTSVLDRWCRTHDVPNLWVVDGSFFPTSGGYNPTLTILANAYRVADHFIAEAKRQNL